MPDMRISEDTILLVARLINEAEDMRDAANEALKDTWADHREALKSLGLTGKEISAEIAQFKAAITDSRMTATEADKREQKAEGKDEYLAILTSSRARARERKSNTAQNTSNSGPDDEETQPEVTTPQTRVAALRADPALAIVEPAIIESKLQKVQTAQTEPQPSPKAGSDLTEPAVPAGQAAPHPPEPIWQSGAPAGMERHRYSEAFGTLGQDIVVIADDVMKGKAAPIVMLGDQVLDGWARFQVAIGAVGLTGQSTEYQVVQYDGTDPLLDCIRWNIGGRMLSNTQKQTVVNRLCAIEPKRKAEIIKAVAEMAI